MKLKTLTVLALCCALALSACTISTGRPKVTVTSNSRAATQAPGSTEITPGGQITDTATAAPTDEHGVAPAIEITPTDTLPATEVTPTVELSNTNGITLSTTTTVTVEAGGDIVVDITDIKTVVFRTTLNVRNGPGLNFKIVGRYRARRTAEVTGASTDGKWYRVLCVNGEVGDCWVTADTRYVIANK